MAVTRRWPSISSRRRWSPSDFPETLTSSWRSGALSDQVDGVGGCPLVEFGDQSGALGDVEKSGGRDQVAAVVEHPKQQLVLMHLSAAEVEDRLSDQGKAIVLECLLDPADPRQLRFGAAHPMF